MNEIKYFTALFLMFLFTIITIDSHSAGFCKDNIPGVCASSPFCVNKKIGDSCRGTNTCRALGKKVIGDCCTCSNVRKTYSKFPNTKFNTEFLNDYKRPTYRQGKPYYEYSYPEYPRYHNE